METNTEPIITNSDIDIEEKKEKEKAPVYTPVKYYDIDEVWTKSASPDDIIEKFTLCLKMGERILAAHMIVDPLLEITKRQITYMLSEGFVIEKKTTIKRSELAEEDERLLRKSQYTNPELLNSKSQK